MTYAECFSELKRVLSELGIKKGDIVYVASDATLLLTEARKKYGVKTSKERDMFLNCLVDSLQEIVGTEGTLLFPVFTWAFCRGKGFDVKSTPGEVGALNNWVLAKRLDFRRTQHPLYSFMVWGAEAETFLAMDNVDAWDEKSPFAYLHHNNGKMMLFNVSLQRAFTFMHYVGRSIRVPYRYLKNFRGLYTDADGETIERNYIMYVRDLDIISHEYEPEEMLEKPGAMKVALWGNLTLKCIDLPMAYDIVKDDLMNHGGRQCYHFENYAIDWSKGATHEDDLGN